MSLFLLTWQLKMMFCLLIVSVHTHTHTHTHIYILNEYFFVDMAIKDVLFTYH
jgi:hypothetical protein